MTMNKCWMPDLSSPALSAEATLMIECALGGSTICTLYQSLADDAFSDHTTRASLDSNLCLCLVGVWLRVF